MKQISIALNIILIAVLVHFGCNRPESSQQPIVQPNDSMHCITCNQPFQGVLAKNFIEVVTRYRKTRWGLTSPQMRNLSFADTIDSKSLWFSLDTIKKFICFIERYSDSININKDSLGIRLYYGAYPSNVKFGYANGFSDKFNHQMVSILPTIEVDNEAVDFDPYISYKRDHKITYMSNLMNASSKNAVKLTILFSDSGRLCPPNCPSLKFNVLHYIDSAY